MPTEAEYRSAADELMQIATLADHHRTILQAWPVAAAFGDTPVASQAGIAIGDAVTELDRARAGLSDLIELCRRRAAICADFRHAVNAWWDANNAGHFGAPFPEPPHSWVEV